jgi:hypothetical protein
MADVTLEAFTVPYFDRAVIGSSKEEGVIRRYEYA